MTFLTTSSGLLIDLIILIDIELFGMYLFYLILLIVLRCFILFIYSAIAASMLINLQFSSVQFNNNNNNNN